MTIREYLEECILLLTVSPIAEHFQVVKRRETETDGYLRIRVTLTDEGLLEISLYCKWINEVARLIEYRFHWQDKNGKLVKRWDNGNHHPGLKTFPCHLHIGDDENVKESDSMDLWKVFQVMESEIVEK